MIYYAITINNIEYIKQNKLNTIDSVYKHLENTSLINDIYIIATERNDLNQNIHYHILVTMPLENVEIENMWCGQLKTDIEIVKYYNYCKKDGNYKTFGVFPFNTENFKKNWYSEALEKVELYSELGLYKLFKDNPHLLKYMYQVTKLFELMKNSPIK